MAKLAVVEELQEQISIERNTNVSELFSCRSIYNNRYCTVVKNIPIPKLEIYPLQEFSSIKTDFIKAAEDFPSLRKQFIFLNAIKSINKKNTRLSSICLLRTKVRNYIQVNIECKLSEKESIEQTLAFLEV